MDTIIWDSNQSPADTQIWVEKEREELEFDFNSNSQ